MPNLTSTLNGVIGKTISAVDAIKAPDREAVTFTFSDGSTATIESGVNVRRLRATVTG